MEREFKLGEVLVRPLDRTLVVDHDIRQIDYKAMQVLLFLARRPGTVVRKREILDEVWPQNFVSEEVLTVSISRLRRALGDQARSPRFIETVPQIGYRLITSVEPESLPVPSAEKAPPPKNRRRLLAVIIITNLLALGWLAGFLKRTFRSDRDQKPAEEISSLVVLPLANLTGDRAQAHIAEGVTEALITGLARDGDLRVVSRASVQRYQDDRPDLTEIASELGVEALLEGSVQRSGERLRIAIRLSDASGDHHLWAATFDGELRNLLDLQQQILAAIERKLALSKSRHAPSVEVSPAAYEAYLRGRYLLGQSRNRLDLQRARRELETAIALEPEYGEAFLSLAEVWLALGEELVLVPHQAFVQVRKAATRALQIGRRPASAHALLAMVHFLYDWDFEAAENEFQKAIEIDGAEILARDGYSRLLTVLGRFDEALAQQRVLGELNPLIYHQPYLAFIYNMSRSHERALGELHKQLEIAPDSARLHSHLASTYRWLGRTEKVLAPFRRYLELSHTPPQKIRDIETTFSASGVSGASLLIFEHFQKLKQSGERVPVMSCAEVLAIAGQTEEAIDQLHRAYERREPGLLLIGQSPDYDRLRSHSRFRELLQRIGLPGEPGFTFVP